MGLSHADFGVLRCPVADCRDRLHLERPVDPALESGVLRCGRHAYALRGGIPLLLDPEEELGMDGLLRPIYDMIAPVHDLGVRFMLPALQFPDPAARRTRGQ